MVIGLLLDNADTVVTVTSAVKTNDTIMYLRQGEEMYVTANSDCPQFHKISIADVPQNGEVIKYGSFIGYAQKDIHAGDYVHTHNLYSTKVEVKQS